MPKKCPTCGKPMDNEMAGKDKVGAMDKGEPGMESVKRVPRFKKPVKK